MLFATLDPTMRAIVLPSVAEGDPVGHRGLHLGRCRPQLVAAFRATLEEVTAADLVLHVRDIAHRESDLQAEEVRRILLGLGVAEATPVIEIWNKIDLLPEAEAEARRGQAARLPLTVAMSAVTGEGIEALAAAIGAALGTERVERTIFLPFAEGRRRAWAHAQGIVVAEEEAEGGHRLQLRLTPRQEQQFRDLGPAEPD